MLQLGLFLNAPDHDGTGQPPKHANVGEGFRIKAARHRQTIEGTATLEREVIVLREMSEVIKAILPDSEDVNNLIHTFHEYSGEAGVRTTSYKRKANLRRGKKSDFDEVSYTLTLEGDTFQFLDLLHRIETHSRFIAVPSFKITAATRNQIEKAGLAQHKIQLDLQTYKFEQPKSDPVRIEGYERKRDLLAGEINRRRQALTLASFNYRGSRGRRDPWIDPRVEVTLPRRSYIDRRFTYTLILAATRRK